MTLRIATWNLERPSPASWKKLPAQRKTMLEVAADIWVLTETRASISPHDGYVGVHAEPHPERRPDEDERWASIWSRWTLAQEPIQSRWAVAARCETPLGDIVVYAMVLPYAHERGDGTARAWQLHYEEIGRQADDWSMLRARYLDTPLIVAGDLNQSRDGSRWYGTREARDRLSDALLAADLVCVTDADMVANGQLARHHLIDHVCAAKRFVDDHTATVECWEPVNHAGTRMSDHPGVVVTFGGSTAT